MIWLIRWVANWWTCLVREVTTPTPPFKACKRMGAIMYGVWYGRFTPDEAREKAFAWGFSPEDIEEMIATATEPPSYWSTHGQPE